MITRLLTLVIACALAFATPALAKSDKAEGKGGKPDQVRHDAKAKKSDADGTTASDAATAAAVAAGVTLAGVLLSDEDKAIITRYFEVNPQPAAHALPPGIAKNLARGKPIPPGIAKRGVPPELSRQFSLPAGYSLETVGIDVVLIQTGTRIIADVLKDVLKN